MARDLVRDPIERALEPGERILWRQAAPPLRVAVSKLPGLFFMIVWAGFSWCWTGIVVGAMGPMILKQQFPGFFILFPLAFFGVGALFSWIGAVQLWTVVRGIADSWSTHYALTNKRLFIVEGGAVISYEADSFGTIARERGGHALTIGYARLVGIDDPVRVERLVRQHFSRGA
jgi:hypothetical protein